MNNFTITSADSYFFPQGTERQGVEAVAARWPSRRTRRLSSLGILLTALVEDDPPSRETAVVYATSYSESRALEGFLESLPDASPTNFQTSIHPGGITQALIAARCPVETLYPLAGMRALISQALHLGSNSGKNEVCLYFGEERGTWLADLGVASQTTYAGKLRLVADASGNLPSVGLLQCLPAVPPFNTSSEPESEELAKAIKNRVNLQWVSATGSFAINWHKS